MMNRCTAALICVSFFSSTATRFLRSSDDPQAAWKSMPCFLDLARFGLTASENDVIYRQGSDESGPVLVISTATDSKVQRTLVFQDKHGRCNGQAGTLCTQSSSPTISSSAFQDTSSSASSDLAADAAALSASAGGSSGMKDSCGDTDCTADVMGTVALPGGGYVRSMAGALSNLAGKGGGLDVLAVGLGAGTLPLLVQQELQGARVTVVELSSGVVGASHCFGATGLNIVQADGRSYLESAANASMDALLIDVFDGDDKVPSCFTTNEFFQTTRRVLRPGGVLVMNAHSGKTLHNDLHDILPGLHNAFEDVKLGAAPGLANVIVRATNPASSESAPPADTGAVFLATTGQNLDGWYDDAGFATDAKPSSPGTRTDDSTSCHI